LQADAELQEFATCQHASWSRHKSRTRPAAGNHEYGTARAAGDGRLVRAANTDLRLSTKRRTSSSAATMVSAAAPD